jgi:DNA-binding MarR family transcriptional regulator
VAEHAGADRMMASKVVRGLEQRGLLTRFSHESDARALQLQLTPAGRTLTRQAIEVAQAVDQRIFETQAAHLQPALRVIAEQYGKNTFAKE